VRFQLPVKSCLAVPAAALALVCSAASAVATPAATTTSLAVTSGGSAVTTVASGTVVTLTATVQAGSTPVTQGLVNFCDATAPHCQDIHIVGQASLTASGTATVKLRPGPGSHSYEAVFVATISYAASSATAGALTVTPPAIYPSITSLASTGSAGNYTLTGTVFGNGPAAPTGTISFLDSNHSNAVVTTAPQVAGTTALNFATSTSISGTSYLNYVAAATADFNGDGIADLVAIQGAGGAVVLLGNGDGTFTQKTTLSTNADWWNTLENVVVADFNGDGIPDIAITDYEYSDEGPSGGFVEVFLGNGDGTFSPTQQELNGFGPNEDPQTGLGPYATVVGDFNGDGVPDIAVANLDGSLTVVLGNGDGTFKTITGSSALPESYGFYASMESTPGAIAAGDFNGDGILDLAVVNQAGAMVYVLLGNGDGTFTAAASPAAVSNSASIISADVNGDGIPDLVVGGLSGVLLGNGNGTFSLKASSPALAVGTGSAVADFNGDGIPDIVSEAGVFLGAGDGTFTAATTQGLVGSVLTVADLNGDGVPDIAGLASGALPIQLTERQSATATATGVAMMPPGSGGHSIVASYPGNGSYAASASAPATINAAQGTPTVSLTTSATTPVVYGTAVTFTATVSGGGVTPTGTVDFVDGSTLLAYVTLSGGSATFRTTLLPAGPHSVTAQYAGDANYLAIISSPLSVTISARATPTVTIIPSVTSIVYGASVSFTATVAGAGSYPTGSVNFVDGTTVIGAAKVASGTATFLTSALGVGTHSISAGYLGDSNYAAGVSTAKTVTVNLDTPALTLTSSTGAVVVGTSVTFSVSATGSVGTPTGSVIFLNGPDQIGSGALDGAGTASMTTSALPAGLDSITVNYGGNSVYTAQTSSVAYVSVTTPATASSTTLTIESGGAAVNSVAAGTVVTLNAAVLNGSTPVTQGLVNFCDASAAHCEDVHVVGTAQLISTGTASFTFRPGIGSHSYKAEFAGSKNYTASADPSASAAASLAVTYSVPETSVSGLSETGTVGGYTLTATVGGLGPLTPTGTVSFVDTSSGNSVLSTATLGADAGPTFRYETGPHTGAYTDGVVAGDFNGDGRMDLAVANQTNPGTITIMLANPGGTLTTASTIDVGIPYAMAVSDFNGDGKMDIAVVGPSPNGPTVTILLGNGDGTFKSTTTALPTYDTGNDGYGIEATVVAGDLNGDGIPDLSVVTFTGMNGIESEYLQVLLGKGDGTFLAPPLSASLGSGVSTLTMADFNGDGIPDLLVLNAGASGTADPSSMTVWVGKGDGTFAPTATSTAVASSPSQGYSVAAADFNGDGIPDLAVSSTDSSCIVQVFLGNGDATFAVPQTYAGNCYSQQLIAADFSGDGIADLAQQGSQIGMLIGKGDGTFTAAASTPTASSTGAVADFNGDGVPDLALLTGTATAGEVWVMLASPHTATASVAGVAIEPPGSGAHLVATSYPGDGTYAASLSPTVTLTAAQGTPTVNVAMSPNPAAYGASVTVTATVAGLGSVPTGTVQLYDGATPLSTATLNSSGAASYVSTTFSVGAHTITATYSGDTDYDTAASTGSTLNVNPASGVAAVSVMPASSSITGQQALAVAVTVSGGSGSPTPTGTVKLTSGTFTSAAATLSGGTASINIPAGTLKLGANTLTVVYSGSATYSSASGTASVTVTEVTPAVTVTPASGTIVTLPITTLESLKVTIAVSGGTGEPAATGTVILSGGSYNSAAVSLVSGSASITIPAGALPAGTDTVTAVYTPDTAGSANYTGAAGTAQVFVITAAPTVSVTPAASSISTVQSLKVTVAVNGGAGSPTPTGTVILSGGSYTSAAAALAGGSATITVPAATLAVGSDTLSVTYTPDTAGSATYSTGTGTASVTVSKAASTTTPTLSASIITTAQGVKVAVAVSGGSGNPAPGGTVTLTSGSYSSAATTLSSGSATISIAAGTLPVGADTITATYAGSAVYLASSGSTTVTVSSAIGTSASTVTVTPASLFITNQETDAIAIAVTGASGQPTGTITLSSGSYSAQQTLAGGAASITIPAGALPAGPDTLTASYSGDATYAISSGTAVVTVSELISNASGSTTVSAGGDATPSVTIAAGSTYSGTLDLACKLTGSPSGAVSLPTCSLNPATLTLAAGGNGTTKLTIATTAASTASLVRPSPGRLWGLGSEGAVLAVLLMCGIPTRRRRLASMLGLFWLVAVGLTIGCGGGGGGAGNSGNSGPVTPATTVGNYTFTVTGTDASNSTISTSTTVSVTVK
jgi:hypothetical protein